MSLEKILETIKDSYIGGHFTILSLDNQLQCDTERYGHENIYFDSIYDGEMREEVESESHCFIVEIKTNIDRKSTRLNSSHANISYAVFCLKKKYKQCTTI